nr:ABC transporter ATP-binding protein [Lachnoclostridium sp. Marseille-P6806]
MQNREVAIRVTGLNKMYKLYPHNRDRVADALGFKGAHYTEHMALENVDLTVYRGETVGIIGTNGSGKSTILKIITGVLNPTSGDVAVAGRISALLELGAGFNLEYNGIENIYLNGTMIGFSEQEIADKIDAILDFADIGEYVYQPVKTYSSGMFMRLAFAVAINIEPEILIVDEALSVGDVFFQAKCYHKFEEFKKQGKTVLFVSHDLSNISKYCDRVVLLNRGHKLGEGSPKEMIDIYKQVLVGQYDPNGGRTHGNALPNGMTADEAIFAAAAKKADEADAKVKGDSAERARAAAERMQVSAEGAETQGTSENRPHPKAEARAEGEEAPVYTADELRRAEKSAGEDMPEAGTLEYGSGRVKITEYWVTDDGGKRSTTILKGTLCTVHMRVKILEDIAAPIFAFTIRNVYGVELCGTNTMFEKAFLEPVRAGEEKTITFSQRMDLQGGEYLLSFGCTGFEKESFTVYHRLYDAMNLTVVSDKNTVGYYDMNSVVTVS